jgi:hypothetical protein
MRGPLDRMRPAVYGLAARCRNSRFIPLTRASDVVIAASLARGQTEHALVGFRSAMLAPAIPRPRGMDHVSLDATRLKPARQPEAVAAGFRRQAQSA